MAGTQPSERELTSIQTVQSSTTYNLSVNSWWIQLKIRDFRFYSLFNNRNHRTTKLLNILWLKVL